MSQTFQHDPLDVLTRAEKSADDWWTSTLKNAKARTDLDQQHWDNAFKNDKQFMTHGSDLFKTNSENTYRGTRAQYDTMLEPDRYDTQKSVYGRDNLRAQDETWQLENAMSPTNRAARMSVYNDRFQSPAAALQAGVASAGIADTQQAARAAQDAAALMPGALSAQATYGRAATQAGSLNLANDIATGNFDRANEALAAGGFNMKIMPAPNNPGKVVVVDEQGRASMPLEPSAVEAQFRDRTGTRQGNAGTYAQGVAGEQRKFDQETALNNARIAQRDRYTQARMSTEMGKRLTERLRNARTEEERANAQEDLDTYLSESPAGGAAYGTSGPQAPDGQSMRSIMMGTPAAQAAPAPAAQAAPVPAAPAAAPAAQSVYSPNQGVTHGSAPVRAHAPVILWKPGQAVDDASMHHIEQAYVTANSKLKQVRSDWERANSLQNRAAVSPEVRERIKAVLDAVRAETDQVNSQYFGAKREWMRVRGEQAYSPSRSLQQTANESINRDFGARYGN
ncbi:hypothetical protein [Limnohabitans sp. WS1]|uniref:hypothetical protein n=1 Tax=Limnohabitans sp. WS1 TaxID=1100726 RepID=UPI000D384533|nr:hypothetical protein [Limnohabitans sp. WS1]PUE15490.1 hypothetical protein B9Z48_11540 [Limnohabitans sp. WS1]